jgi:glycosyltransferase involved in cell wall biosynthesis
MHIAHINLAKGFRGGERQTGLLIDSLAETYPLLKQSLIVRYDSPLPSRLKNLDKVNLIKVSKPYLIHALFIKENFDIIHAHEAKACHFSYVLSKKTDCIYTMTRRMDRAPKNDFFTRKVYRKCVHIVCLSSAIETIIKQYSPNSNVSIIPSMKAGLPFDEDNIKAIRDSFPKKIIVGHVGALVAKHKGQEYIIKAAKILQQSHPSIHFLLVGEGSDEVTLKKQAEGLKNISFIGFKKNVGDYLRAFDIFLFPSLQEGLGSTLLDAMEAKLPIIATSVGGIPDIICHQKNGLLIESKNAQKIVDEVLSLLSKNTLAKSLAQQGLSDSVQYSPAVIGQRYMDIYKKLIVN